MQLVIAEKKSVAAHIAAVLGAIKEQGGYFYGNSYTVSWCIGHLIELAPADAYDEKYAKWRYEDLPILPKEWKYNVSADKQKQFVVLKQLLSKNDIEYVINACDAGREGELIFREVYEYVKCHKPIKRLWISSMEESAIAEGFRNLADGAEYERLYQSALCRARADWIVGINATRLFSVIHNETLNVGRVQTPTLAMIVERDAAIKGFVKESLYTVELDCEGFTLSSEKLKVKQNAETIRAACDGKSATITSIDRQQKKAKPPELYDLTTLQREANRLFGYTAQQTLDYVQSMYEKKLCTYPRTDSRYLSEDMKSTTTALVADIVKLPTFAYAKSLTPDVSSICDNTRISDHHAIVPTATMTKGDLNSLPSGERNVLCMIAVRLLCAVSQPHVYDVTTVAAKCEGNTFTAKGKTVVCGGWKGIEQSYKATLKENPKEDTNDKSLPDVSNGQVFEHVKSSIKEGFTSPPKPFSEDTLLQSMEVAGAQDMPDDAERKGLGTPATRASIIEKLIKSGFVERQKRNLIPTQKGMNLIAVLPEQLKSPALTAEWEHGLIEVERGIKNAETFLMGIAGFTISLVATNPVSSAEVMARSSVGRCPRCGGSVREGTKGFYCMDGECGFCLWKDCKFFSSKKKTLTKDIAVALLTDGRALVKDMHSEKTGKKYDATVILDDTGEKYVGFKLEFAK